MFLKHYAKGGRLMKALEAAGIDHTTHYRRLQTDEGYRAAVEAAEQEVAQRVEDRVIDMAMEGELAAALALLRRFRPALYREAKATLDVSLNLNLVEKMRLADQRVIETTTNGHA